MSSKTLKSNAEKIVLEPKAPKEKHPHLFKTALFVILLLIALATLTFLLYSRGSRDKTKNCIRTDENVGAKCLVKLQYAQSPAEHAQGLSNRPNLPADSGLLFIFVAPAQQCFWMKDMQFPIDIIWLSSDKQIQHIEKNVSPSTYPNTLCPQASSQYVVEVNAGVSDALGFRQDQKLVF